jgi:hypothetical protein
MLHSVKAQHFHSEAAYSLGRNCNGCLLVTTVGQPLTLAMEHRGL